MPLNDIELYLCYSPAVHELVDNFLSKTSYHYWKSVVSICVQSYSHKKCMITVLFILVLVMMMIIVWIVLIILIMIKCMYLSNIIVTQKAVDKEKHENEIRPILISTHCIVLIGYWHYWHNMMVIHSTHCEGINITWWLSIEHGVFYCKRVDQSNTVIPNNWRSSHFWLCSCNITRYHKHYESFCIVRGWSTNVTETPAAVQNS